MIKTLKYLPVVALSIVLTGGATKGLTAQTTRSQALLIAQNQSLDRSDINQVIDFYEWVFRAKFTPAQRSEFQSITLNRFNQDPAGTKKSIDELIANYTEVIAQPEAAQSRVRQGFTQEFVEQLRKLPNDAEAKLLLSVYESANSQTASTQPEGSAEGVGNVSTLTGKWVWARTGSGTYTQGGAYLGANGSRFTYQFQPNGTVEFTGIMNVMSGGCNQQIFQSRKGRVRLSGSTLTINWSPGTFTRDFSCDSANNYTKTVPAENETYQVRFKADVGQRQLCLTRKDETCYSPTN
ncbi:hypothetical protein NC981_17545 [Leptolyngbya sp. DQ-M1]|uniref:hypothetical protein n=1 Tax=Leptolyngbya sp. DQ-M1 TaxID=2933920 RepID=UPI00329A39C8